MEIQKDDLTRGLSVGEEVNLVNTICKKFDDFENRRSSQLSDIKMIKNAIYDFEYPRINSWDTRMSLPDIYELAQTLKSHLSQNLYSHSDAMFDVSGTTPQTQMYANRQKAMLVNTFERMNIENILDKIIDSIVETGESTLFIGWETKIKQIRRALTLEEQLQGNFESGFVIEDKIIYDNAKIKHIKPEDFVFDKFNADNWDACAKIYRTYSSLDEIISNTSKGIYEQTQLDTLFSIYTENNANIDKQGIINKIKENKYFIPNLNYDISEKMWSFAHTIWEKARNYKELRDDSFEKCVKELLKTSTTIGKYRIESLNEQYDIII